MQLIGHDSPPSRSGTAGPSMCSQPPFLRFSENLAACFACDDLVQSLYTGGCAGHPDPLVLHGPTGVGKSCLVAALVESVGPSATSCVLSANAFPLPWDRDCGTDAATRYEEARKACLLAIEDLQHLPDRATEALVQLLDARQPHGLRTVVTANSGPAAIARRDGPLPARLVNRLISGLVVAIAPPGTSSRLLLLQELSRRRGVCLSEDILRWLAHAMVGGGRQLDGTLQQIEVLRTLTGKPPSLDELRRHFRVPIDAAKPTVERIVNRVSAYFRIDARRVPSPRRHPALMVPRQISMYLARRLTPLSLQQIGHCFGGRDHTTVLHACRKIEEGIKTDARLFGIVRQLHAELA